MARRLIKKRIPDPDPRFGDTTVAKFINQMMLEGKKAVVRAVFYEAMDLIEKKAGKPPLDCFKEALEQVKPRVEVKSRRVGGATYQVPVEVRSDRREALGMKWLIGFARSRTEKGMAKKLAGEIVDAMNQAGGAFRKKEDTHRMAEANKAFAHYRW